jgi:hypothetical protein
MTSARAAGRGGSWASLRWARFGRARVAGVVFGLCALMLTLGAATARASLLSPVSTFGSPGSGPGQFGFAFGSESPQGVAVQQTSGNVFVTDPANSRVEKFDPNGNFISAFGQDRLSVPAGLGGGATLVATDGLGKVYVGDNPGAFAGCSPPPCPQSPPNVVQKFDANGNFVSTIDGSNAPQGRFQALAGVAVDQNNNLWVTDAGTGNVIEFDSKGRFVRQWNDTHGRPPVPTGPIAIAVDSARNAVYLNNGGAERWTLSGRFQAQVDGSANQTALALDPGTGNLYVDHAASGADVKVYDPTGTQLDDLSLGSSTNSLGIAFASLTGGSDKLGQQDLYVSDSEDQNVTIFAPRTTPGAPLITFESVDRTGKTTATLHAVIVPLGHDTSCKFEYVGNTDFQASGFDNATDVPCTPSDLGSGFGYQAASAGLSGLSTGAYYHFRVVASSSAGTTTGEHQEFQAGPGAWAPFFRCPVDDPAMLNSGFAACLASNSTHGSIKIGNLATQTTGNTNLQVGLVVEDFSTFQFSVIPPPGGALVADPVQITGTPVGTVTAATESAGAPSDFDLIAGIETGVPIITVPIKIQLQNPALGPSCFIGSDQEPILLHPENRLVATFEGFGFDPNGALDQTGPLGANVTTGVQGDDTFSVPGANGCGPNGDGSLDPVVNAVVGLPSPSGNNHLVLDDASSALAFASGENGQQFADFWHTGFGP